LSNRRKRSHPALTFKGRRTAAIEADRGNEPSEKNFSIRQKRKLLTGGGIQEETNLAPTKSKNEKSKERSERRKRNHRPRAEGGKQGQHGKIG